MSPEHVTARRKQLSFLLMERVFISSLDKLMKCKNEHSISIGLCKHFTFNFDI